MEKLMRSYLVPIVCGFILFSQLAYAQETKPSGKKEGAPAQSSQKEPAHQQIAKDLGFLLGKWETKVKVMPMGFSATKQEIKGEGTIEYTLFGNAIEGTIKSESNVGTYNARELIFPSLNKDEYDVLRVNSNGLAIGSTMKKVGDVLEVTSTGKRALVDLSGKPGKLVEFMVKGKYKIVSDKELQYHSDISVGHGPFKPYISYSFTRIP